MSVDFDLLGDPIPKNHGQRGRPEHIPSDRNRRLVIQLVAFGRTLDEIAGGLGITQKTLRKHYSRELGKRCKARARVEAKLLAHLMDQVEAGNVAAIKEYRRQLDRHDLDLARELTPPKKEKKGKKVIEREEAQSAHEGSSWGALIN